MPPPFQKLRNYFCWDADEWMKLNKMAWSAGTLIENQFVSQNSNTRFLDDRKYTTATLWFGLPFIRNHHVGAAGNGPGLPLPPPIPANPCTVLQAQLARGRHTWPATAGPTPVAGPAAPPQGPPPPQAPAPAPAPPPAPLPAPLPEPAPLLVPATVPTAVYVFPYPFWPNPPWDRLPDGYAALVPPIQWDRDNEEPSNDRENWKYGERKGLKIKERGWPPDYIETLNIPEERAWQGVRWLG
jgi:hypothetical protein